MFSELLFNMSPAGRAAIFVFGVICFILLYVLDRQAVKRREQEGRDSQPPSKSD
ncbi:hypothetical protein [Paenibacillus sp. MY03]|uniref:hypothetical protein n=1 Tax=Paenibacillus sp. MY03 TaxID=302980 RepID=UPI0015C67A86|nr:hypothetical protein [Paenibacillus sp. MY03]